MLLLVSAMGALVTNSLANDAHLARLAGRLEIQRSGNQFRCVIVGQEGTSRPVIIPKEIVAANDGYAELEGAYVTVEGEQAPGALKVVHVDRVTPDRLEFVDPLVRFHLPQRSELAKASPSYKGPIKSVYDAIRAKSIKPSDLSSALLPGPRAFLVDFVSQTAGRYGVRLYIGQDSRHYYLITHGGRSMPGSQGVRIEEIFENRTRSLGAGVEVDCSSTTIRSPRGGTEWAAGETFRDAYAGSVRIDATTIANAVVTVSPFQAANADVTNTNDSGAGSLRSAMAFHTANPSVQVNFKIPISDANFVAGVANIKLLGPLPAITVSSTKVDGGTQRTNIGNTNPDGPEVYVDASATTGALSISTGANSCIIREIGITGAQGNAIQSNANGATIQKCFIGFKRDGITPAPNLVGINVFGGSGSLIGGASTDGNIVSGNQVGIRLGGGASANKIEGNKVGTDPLGKFPVGNNSGVDIQPGCTDNSVGSKEPIHGNVISANSINGVTVSGERTLLLGNRVGTSADALSALPNTTGLSVVGASGTIIGDADPAGRNIIAGNKGLGISVRGAINTRIVGNRIGIGANNVVLPNSGGIGLDQNCQICTIGSSVAGEGNIVSGSKFIGIGVKNSSQVSILGNRIGTTVDGNSAAGNGAVGVQVFQSFSVDVGGTAVGAGNVISGNKSSGVVVASGCTNVTIRGNSIGSNLSQTAALGNVGGIQVAGGVGSLISNNTIVGNSSFGVKDAGSGTVLRSNYIGQTSAGLSLPNVGNGVMLLVDSKDAVIGGSKSGNFIVNNIGVGIFVAGARARIAANFVGTTSPKEVALNGSEAIFIANGAARNQIGLQGQGNFLASNRDVVRVTGNTTVANKIRFNQVLSIAGLDINLETSADPADHVTPNDGADADSGPNELQNFPVLNPASFSSGSVSISGTVINGPNKVVTIDFYTVQKANTQNHGGAVTYLGSVNVDMGAAGGNGFSASFPLAKKPAAICATSTDAAGNTSEMSLNVAL